MKTAPAQAGSAAAQDDEILPPPFDMSGDLSKVPDYKQDTDWVQAVVSQFRLVRGVRGKIRAAFVILIRMLP